LTSHDIWILDSYNLISSKNVIPSGVKIGIELIVSHSLKSLISCTTSVFENIWLKKIILHFVLDHNGLLYKNVFVHLWWRLPFSLILISDFYSFAEIQILIIESWTYRHPNDTKTERSIVPPITIAS